MGTAWKDLNWAEDYNQVEDEKWMEGCELGGGLGLVGRSELVGDLN